MARKVTSNTYRKEKCPICGKDVSIQGKTNHMRKHEFENANGNGNAVDPVPRKIEASKTVEAGSRVEVHHESYRQGYREGYQDGQRSLLERFKLLGFLDRLTQAEIRQMIA